MGKPLAIFDLDFTLVEADCELVWCDVLFRLGIVDQTFMRRIDQFDEDYAAGHLDYPAFDDCLLSPLKPFSLTKINELLQAFMEEVRPRIRPWMMTRVEEHRRQGYEVLLATASNSFLTEPLARMLNFFNFVCTPIEMISGKPTGRIIGKAAFREGKVEHLQKWLSDQNSSLDGSWGYSDSHNDIPLLSLVEHPVVVTPDDRLREYARNRGWMIFNQPADLTGGSKVFDNETASS
jgi:HAD superfamily hydrolase (TIGR01490 family)